VNADWCCSSTCQIVAATVSFLHVIVVVFICSSSSCLFCVFYGGGCPAVEAPADGERQ
jgi:hypothetical protein